MRGGLGAPWILDPGSWNLWAVGCACGGPWILDAGICGRRGPAWAGRGFCILYPGNWAVGGTVDRCGPPGFCILYSGSLGVEGGRTARILYSVFCILPATCACDAYAWEQGWHMSGCWILDSGNWAVRGTTGVWAARILYSVFCILPAAYARYAYARERVSSVCSNPPLERFALTCHSSVLL